MPKVTTPTSDFRLLLVMESDMMAFPSFGKPFVVNCYVRRHGVVSRLWIFIRKPVDNSSPFLLSKLLWADPFTHYFYPRK